MLNQQRNKFRSNISDKYQFQPSHNNIPLGIKSYLENHMDSNIQLGKELQLTILRDKMFLISIS